MNIKKITFYIAIIGIIFVGSYVAYGQIDVSTPVVDTPVVVNSPVIGVKSDRVKTIPISSKLPVFITDISVDSSVIYGLGSDSLIYIYSNSSWSYYVK